MLSVATIIHLSLAFAAFWPACQPNRQPRRTAMLGAMNRKFILRILDLTAGNSIFHQRFSACLHLITLIFSFQIVRTDNGEAKCK